MRDYAKVEPKMWLGGTMKALRRSPEGVIVAMYLMTSPQSNMLGLYCQPILYMAHETGLGFEGASKGLQACIDAGYCSYDKDTEFVWVHEMAKYQIANELKASDLRCKGIQKDYDGLPDNPFLAPFFDRYCGVFHLSSKRGLEGAYQGATKPLRSQEQEQEQEQEKEKEPSSLRSEGGAAKSPPPPKPGRKKGEAITLAAYLQTCKAESRKPVPDEHHIRSWCADAGIVPEMLQVCWTVFKERYTEDEKAKRKRFIDWPGHFANGVKANWFKLWYVGDDGRPTWSSVGLTRKAVLDARMGKTEAAHGHA